MNKLDKNILNANMVVLYPEQANPLYCFQHDVTFSNQELFDGHMAECLDLLVKKNVCRFIEPGQPMCAVSFNTTSALIFHYFLEHGRYLCNNCTLSFFSMHDLEIHQHSVEQAHESNY